MFKRHEVTLTSTAICIRKVEDIDASDFQYYDKDGFELNLAEQKFYSAMGFPINYPILNHHCWQEPWFELDSSVDRLILDHSVFLCRCSYEKEAADQLKELKTKMPQADLLLRTRRKWGFDFALDCVADEGTVYEVLHVEYDNCDFETFKNRMISFEWTVRNTDWKEAAESIWNQRDQWQHLQGFEQNHWKSKYLLGWSKAEYTEKSI